MGAITAIFPAWSWRSVDPAASAADPAGEASEASRARLGRDGGEVDGL